jgi:hypothetical protein
VGGVAAVSVDRERRWICVGLGAAGGGGLAARTTVRGEPPTAGRWREKGAREGGGATGWMRETGERAEGVNGEPMGFVLLSHFLGVEIV